MSHYSFEPAKYTDYRDFLKARFEALKAENKNFSLMNCARKSKISKALLQFLFNKKRHISLDKFPPLAKALKLTNDEEYFVYLMICQNASQNQFVKMHFEKILMRIRHEFVETETQAPTRSDQNSKSFYQDANAMFIQALVRLPEFQEDTDWILKHLPVRNLTKGKVEDTIQEMLKMGAVERDSSGRLQVKELTVWRPDPYDPTGHSVYTKAAEAMAELMQTPEAYRPSVYMSMSLAMDEKHLHETEKLMIDVHHKLCEFAKQSTKPTATVFIGNFFLTLARLKPAKKN